MHGVGTRPHSNGGGVCHQSLLVHWKVSDFNSFNQRTIDSLNIFSGNLNQRPCPNVVLVLGRLLVFEWVWDMNSKWIFWENIIWEGVGEFCEWICNVQI